MADGSQIELNTDTAALLNIKRNSRNVELLRGEAYFQVNHDASRPFVVTIGAHRIVDLGTKFIVRADAGTVKVTLVSGSARIEDAGHQGQKHSSMVLLPGEVAVATADATRVSKHTFRELSESLAWQRGSIVFHNELLSSAAAELNRYDGPTLIVADSAAKLKISGTFLTNNTEEFAGAARELFGLRVEHQNGSVVLSR